MLVLVSGANFFVMFVGWEGIAECLKWENNENFELIVIHFLVLIEFMKCFIN
jgi:hypothetical protein